MVKELADELKDAEAIFAVDYRGISVPQAAELRSGLRDADARFRIVKNRLTLRAADEAGTETLKEHLEGPTALAFVKGDAALAAKTIFRLGSEWELLEYKGGLMAGEALDADSFKAIARLPGRDQLDAQFAGIVASPLTGLVRGLGSMIQGLALQLGQIAEQGLVTGEPPPAEETPKEDAAPAAADAEEDSGEAAGGGEDAASDSGEADSEDVGGEAAEAEDGSSDGEAEAPAAEESKPDPEPEQSPEETSEEQAPEGEDAAGGEAAETSEGDQDIGEEPAAEESPGGTEEAGGGEETTSEDSDNQKEEGS